MVNSYYKGTGEIVILYILTAGAGKWQVLNSVCEH